MQGKALPDQAAAAWPRAASQQALRIRLPLEEVAARNELPMPESVAGTQVHVTPGDAAQSGLPMSSRQQAAAQHSFAGPHVDEDDCVVCLDNARTVLFLTCGHMVRLLARLLLAHSGASCMQYVHISSCSSFLIYNVGIQ